MHTDNTLADLRAKIAKVKENRNDHYKFPREILTILSMREAEEEDRLFFLKQPTF